MIDAAIKRMEAPAATPTPTAAKTLPWTNFAKIGTCHPIAEHHPSTTEEVAALVKQIRASGSTCRVVGSGKSPNSCTFTDGHLIHMDRMNRILSVDAKGRTITCQGGACMEHVLRTLDASELMLRCVPSYVKTTVAGCIGTATHSSGIGTTSLSDYVQRLVLVDGTGAVHSFARDGPGAAELPLTACHLGALGVIVEVTLQVEPRAVWHLRSRPLSIFEACDAAAMARKVRENEYYRFWWVPHTNCCYESYGRRVNVGDGAPDRAAYVAWQADQRSLKSRCLAAAKGDWLRHTVVERKLYLACERPWMQPWINKAYARAFYSTPSEQYGSTLECFTFDCLFKQWANEWAIPAEKAADALMLLREMIDKRGLRVHFPVELRFTSADTSAMSPAVGRETCWMGIVMYRPHLHEARDTKAYYDGFNEIMQRLGGRPHWGKYYAWGGEEMERAYGARWSDFLSLRKRLDPSGVFLNPWLSRLISTGSPRVNSTSSVPARSHL